MNTLTDLKLLKDEPVKDPNKDYLGLGTWSRVVAAAVLGNHGPFTIAVFGQWGVGKTTVLNMAQHEIAQHEIARKAAPKSEQGHAPPIVSVSFNAWEHDRAEEPIVPLLAAIIQRLSERKSRGRQSGGELRDALRSALYGLSAKVTGKIPMMGEVNLTLEPAKAVERFSALQDQWLDKQMEQNLHYNAFETLRKVQRSSPEKRQRVVVFIDDLDRCLPDRAVRLLESMKILLSEPGFTFVLAVDRRVLEAYLDKRFLEYGLEEPQRGASYLAKFIQLPLWIPSHEDYFDSFIEKMLEEAELASGAMDLRSYRYEISLASGRNPRQLIRFLNDLLVDRFVFEMVPTKSDLPFELLVIARGVRLRSEVVYYALLASSELCSTVQRELGLDTSGQVGSVEESRSHSTLDPETEILSRLLVDRNLQDLLRSKLGQEWLSKDDERRDIETFLTVERREGAVDEEFANWLREGTERSLDQLDSDIKEDLGPAFHWLAFWWHHVDYRLRKQAVAGLRHLAASGDAWIADNARQTLDEITRQEKG